MPWPYRPLPDPNRTGGKDEPCRFFKNGVHQWTTMEGISESGGHFKWTECKGCGRLP